MPTTVLVIDDSATIRFQVSRALRASGFVPIEAADGILGLAVLKDNPSTCLIVCDLNMPNMNGLEFLENMPAASRRIPVVILTTEGQPELSDRARALGAKAWILKPFKSELFIAAVKKLAAVA